MSRRIMGYRAKLVMIAVAITAMVVGTNAATDDHTRSIRMQVVQGYEQNPAGLCTFLGLPTRMSGAARVLIDQSATTPLSRQGTETMRETVAALRGLLVAIYETMECYGGMASEERSLYGQIGYFAVLDLEERHIDHLIRRSNDGAYDQDPVQEEPESKRIQKEDPGIPTTRLVAYSEIGSFAHAVIDGKVPSMGHCTKQLQVMADVGEMDGLDRRDMYISRVSEILAEHLRQGKHIDVAMADTVNQLRIAYEEADREAALEAERRLSVATEFVMEHGGPHFVSIAMRGGLMGPDEGERLRAVADVGELDDPEGWERYAFKVGAVLEEHLSQGKRIDAAIADTIDQLRRARKEADEPVYDEEAPALGWWSCCDVC